MILSIVIGLLVWLVVPLCFNGGRKHRRRDRAIALTCRIIGLAIIVATLVRYVIDTLAGF